MPDANRVLIIGDHPWTGCTGVALRIEVITYPTGQSERMARVRLDGGNGAPEGHECYVGAGHLKRIA